MVSLLMLVKQPEISLRLLIGIFPMMHLFLIASTTNKAIEITAPNKPALICTNVNAARTGSYTTDSRLTK